MAKGQQTFAKRQKELARAKHRADKADKKRERAANPGSGELKDMMAYLDEFGRITNKTPEQQAIEKAAEFGFDLNGSVMASDAFFPFPDCVEIAKNAGIQAVVQPGGSIKDQLSIDYCDANGMAMVMTGVRHFKH